MFKNNSKPLLLLSLFPFFLWLGFISFFAASISYRTIIMAILLLLSSYGLSSNIKKWNIAFIISILSITIPLFFSGIYSDGLSFIINTYTSILLLIYYFALYFSNKYILKNKTYLNKVNDFFKA